MMMDTLAARPTTTMIAMDDVANPFDHTTPDATIFGIDFPNKLYPFLGSVWGLALVVPSALPVIFAALVTLS